MTAQERLVHIYSSFCGSPAGQLDTAGFVDMMRRCGVMGVPAQGEGSELTTGDIADLFVKSCRSSAYGRVEMALEDFLMVAVPSLAMEMKAGLDTLSSYMMQHFITSQQSAFYLG